MAIFAKNAAKMANFSRFLAKNCHIWRKESKTKKMVVAALDICHGTILTKFQPFPMLSEKCEMPENRKKTCQNSQISTNSIFSTLIPCRSMVFDS